MCLCLRVLVGVKIVLFGVYGMMSYVFSLCVLCLCAIVRVLLLMCILFVI